MKTETEPDDDPTDSFVNYMPAMPNVFDEPSYLEVLADVLFGRTR